MKHYYSDEFGYPPALVVDIVASVQGSARQCKLRAKIDTGADLTVLPNRTLNELRASIFSERMIRAFGRQRLPAPTYLLDINLNNLRFSLEVIGHNQPYALVGRDILNSVVLTADGVDEIFSIA